MDEKFELKYRIKFLFFCFNSGILDQFLAGFVVLIRILCYIYALDKLNVVLSSTRSIFIEYSFIDHDGCQNDSSLCIPLYSGIFIFLINFLKK